MISFNISTTQLKVSQLKIRQWKTQHIKLNVNTGPWIMKNHSTKFHKLTHIVREINKMNKNNKTLKRQEGFLHHEIIFYQREGRQKESYAQTSFL